MKKKIGNLLIVISFLLISYQTAFSYNSQELIVEKNVNNEKIQLIENYIIQHKNKIELFAKKYEIKNNPELNSTISDLSDIIIILRKLKNNNIEQEKRDEIVQKIVEKLRSINKEIKPLLKTKKEAFELKIQKKSQQYAVLGARLSNQLRTIIFNAAGNLNKRPLNEYQKKIIIQALISLEKESKKLKNFSKNHFNSEIEMKQSFIAILKNIKKELLIIKRHY